MWLDIAERDDTPLKGRHKSILPLEAVIWHFTGGPGSPVPWLKQRADGVGWHFTIERDGSIVQHHPLDARCSHAGGSKMFGKSNVNARTIGVELANLGPVEQLSGPSIPAAALVTLPCRLGADSRRRFGRKQPNGSMWFMPAGSDVVVASDGTMWEAFSGPQLASIIRLGLALATAVPAFVDPDRHLAHRDVKSTKQDVHPEVFPWLSLRDTLRDAQIRAEPRE